MDSPPPRVTRSGRSFGAHILGIRDLPGRGAEACASFKVMLAPLFQQAIMTSDLRDEQGVDDNEDVPLEDSPPCRQSLRLSPPFHIQGGLPGQAPTGTQRVPFTTAKTGKIEAARNKDRSKYRRQVHKQKAATSKIPDYRPKSGALDRYCRAARSTRIPFEPRNLPAGNWIGRRVAPLDGQRTWSLSELIGLGMELKPWNGRTTEIIADAFGRALVFMVPFPEDPSWSTSCGNARAVMSQARLAGKRTGAFTVGNKDLGIHRRGSYYSIATGVSFGGRSSVPGNLKIHPKQKDIVDTLCQHNDIRRIVGYQSSMFAFYAPKLYNAYCSHLSQLYDHSPHLRPNFPTCSIFPACTFNLGPGTVTTDHTDHNNVAFGLCAVTALGNYNPTLGGHLVLFDLGLIIEFPPGATILFPSSILRHGNTPIVGAASQRMSITQYCAGGLFRWVNYGFKTGKSLASTTAGKALKKKIDGKLEDRTTSALDLFSTVDSLASDRDHIFGKGAFSQS